jgi:hypothetical protein
MKTLEVRFTTSPLEAPRLVGTLLDQGGRIFFEYAEDWLNTGLNLSPFRLPFERGAFEHRDRAFGPLPGLFADSLPDGWGLLLMDRHLAGWAGNWPAWARSNGWPGSGPAPWAR